MCSTMFVTTNDVLINICYNKWRVAEWSSTMFVGHTNDMLNNDVEQYLLQQMIRWVMKLQHKWRVEQCSFQQMKCCLMTLEQQMTYSTMTLNTQMMCSTIFVTTNDVLPNDVATNDVKQYLLQQMMC